MAENGTFERIDVDRMEQIQRAERPALHIRWWIVLPLAILLCVAQVLLDYVFEFNPTAIYPIATQIPVISFAFLLGLTLLLNPLLRLWWPAALAMVLCGGQLVLMLIPHVPGHEADNQTALRYALLAMAVSAVLRMVFRRPLSLGLIVGAAAVAAQAMAVGWFLPHPLPGVIVAKMGLGEALKAFFTGAPLSSANDIAYARFIGVAVLLDLGAIIAAVGVAFLLRSRVARLGGLAGLLGVHVLAFLALLGHAANIYFFISQIAFTGFILFTLLHHVSAEPAECHRPFRWLEPFNRGELMAVFAALFVTAGICTFGLMDQLVPLIAAPHNPAMNVPLARWDKDVIPHLNPALFISDVPRVEEFRNGFKPGVNLWTAIPWGLWFKPLALWFIFVFAIYLMFYSLSMMLYDSWARREKLVFPLARLPEDVMHDDGAPPGSLSSTLHSGLFWCGFLFVFLLLSYNAAAQAEWLRGLNALSLGINQHELQKMLDHSIFKGLADGSQPGLVFLVSFVAIGIGFLLPLEISASLWIYHLFGMFLFFIAIRAAVAASVISFSSDWMWENHFVSSLGAGGLLAFAGVTLAKLIMDKYAQGRDQAQSDCLRRAASEAEAGRAPRSALCAPPSRWTLLWRCARNFGWGGVVFLVSMAVTLGWLWWAHVPMPWSLIFMAVVILITVGLMRVVAEGGVYWFQIHTGPFHLTKIANGLLLKEGTVKTVVPPSVLAPLMPIYSVLFMEIKTYLAPAVINSFKMQEETRASRRWFHVIVIVSIVVTVLVSAVALLHFAYSTGANQTSSQWFFTSGPRWIFNQTQQLASGATGGLGGSNWIFYLLGIGWIILSVLMRRRFFWWLHPIGFAMMANPLMCQLWFGFFIGWLCKKLAVKYGGRHMFAKVRPIFIGLMFGELAACFFWSLLAYLLGLSKVSIDINRYTP